MTKGGRLPAESVVEGIERRFAGTQTGALARLLRARIRFENKDFKGAAIVLNSDDFERLTKLADYAIWLRGRALQSDGDHAGAMQQFERVVKEFPDSLRLEEAKLRWAESAMITGRTSEVPQFLDQLNNKKVPESLLITAKAYETLGDQPQAIVFFRKAYLYGGTRDVGKEAEARLKNLSVDPLMNATAEEMKVRADRLLSMGTASLAFDAYTRLIERFPAEITPQVHLDRINAASRAGNAVLAQAAFDSMPSNMPGRDQAYRDLLNAYAKAKLWPRARMVADEMRSNHPQSPLTVKAWVEAGYLARDSKNKAEEIHFLRTALVNYPQAVEVAGAQFELAWLEHEAGNSARAADMLIEHLARYADKDSSNRGRAGYWSARNAERSGRIGEACTLYDALVYRYSANWYGHIGLERLNALRARGQCQAPNQFPAGSLVSQAAANLKTVTVAQETSGPREVERAEKSEQLSTIGLFDWAIDELREAQKSAQNSPRINLALAKHYRMKSDNVNALLALAKSYPDYAQMFPEEMGRDEWDIFYPHIAWDQISRWSKARNLDIYKVAGLIRQESVFNPTARSSANAYGLMQLLLPTAQLMARKYGSAFPVSSAADLYNTALNIELGTAYMRENLDKYGRIEYMAVAYNAGPGRVVTWRRTLPLEMDEFVEAIPFRETKGYVQGIIRNTAQYRRLYDENGNFKPNVGTRPLRGAVDSTPREQFLAENPDIRIE
ncbi:transglycosylase SLT domain-containing protein [Leptolyngbya sp. 7M]|uniref:lytic transglycosylase domain-containing protein n=1 Tax=Leptolyngbya sp. 7M TaxID=2812896 RepID=UPI001B8BC98F|nr:transglycosylase SLT domain-containing protein [Leptolyngbya sp. 7M]QYO66386.1 transglycosylase SLT domain-containing protein [Leptolyngbya sp. 7M]